MANRRAHTPDCHPLPSPSACEPVRSHNPSLRAGFETPILGQVLRQHRAFDKAVGKQREDHGNSRRFRGADRSGGLLNATIQGLLSAAGQNLKRLVAATGLGPHHVPCGSLAALAKEP